MFPKLQFIPYLLNYICFYVFNRGLRQGGRVWKIVEGDTAELVFWSSARLFRIINLDTMCLCTSNNIWRCNVMHLDINLYHGIRPATNLRFMVTRICTCWRCQILLTSLTCFELFAAPLRDRLRTVTVPCWFHCWKTGNWLLIHIFFFYMDLLIHFRFEPGYSFCWNYNSLNDDLSCHI